MILDETIQAITRESFVPKVIDTVLESNVLALRLLSNPKPFTGSPHKIPIKYRKSTSGGSYDGYDLFSTQRSDTRTIMQFMPKGFYQSVTVSGMEDAINKSAPVTDLIATEMESNAQDMVDTIGDLFYGDGTGNGGKDFTGLVALVDDGSNVLNYGGLSRATFPTIQGNLTTGVGNLTLSAMATMYNDCTVGSDKPTLIVCDETVWTYYESLLQPTVQANYDAAGFSQVTKSGVSVRGALQGEAGFDCLYYRGTPIVKDEKCPAGEMYFLNEKYINFHALNRSDLETKSASGNVEGAYSNGAENQPGLKPFYWTGFKHPVNQDAIIGQFIANGDLINANPNRSGRMTGITGV